MAIKSQIEKALADYAGAAARGRARRDSGNLAVSAHYEARRRRIHVELKSGGAIAVPVRLLQGLADSSAAKLRKMVVTGGGFGLHWPELDVDLSVPDLIAGSFGTRSWMRALGKRGGSSSSAAKAAAARENGKRGGRPRKTHPDAAAR